MTTTVRYTTINGEVIAEKRNGVRSLYVPDPLGSTRALVNNSQVQTDTFSYWPYGEQQSHTGSTSTPFQFVGTRGYYKDAPASTTGRCYVRARYLDMAKGRWLTKDPSNTYLQWQNLYAYARLSPIRYRDSNGKDDRSCLEIEIDCLKESRADFGKCLVNICHISPSVGKGLAGCLIACGLGQFFCIPFKVCLTICLGAVGLANAYCIQQCYNFKKEQDASCVDGYNWCLKYRGE